nr:LysR family transcriptional regulator [Kineosporia babensis]
MRYFVAVADAAGFTRAAEQLGMATSPLSRRIRELEKELGAELFVRDYHRVSLTPAGERLLVPARDVVERFDALPALVPPQQPQGLIVVGTAPEVSPDLRSRFTTLVREQQPGLRVRHRPGSTAPLLRAVVKGEVDLAFVHGLVEEPGLSVVPVESQPLRVVVAAGTGFDERESLELTELAHLPYTFLRATSAPYVAQIADSLLSRYGVSGRLPVPTGHADLVPMVSAGEAFTICGARFGATRNAFLGEPVLMLPFDDGRLRLVTSAVWRTGHAPGSLAALVAALATLPKGNR